MPRHASVGSEQASQVSKRRPIPRKGHRKSRAGCAVCKTRKVKCDETAPTCGPCQRLGLECRYLGIDKQAQALAGVRSSLGAPSSPLRTEPAVFNGDDLRFFHQFLFSAYPSLPIGGWKVWQAAGQMAHHVSVSRTDIAQFTRLRLGVHSMNFSSTRCSVLGRHI